ncbi:MAG: hypothetical protein Kow0074_12650 [Candidatus Zixiibacteriota bacterium]
MVSRIAAIGLLVSVMGAGCSHENPLQSSQEDQMTQSVDGVEFAAPSVSNEVLERWRHRDPVTFEVRIENVSTAETLPVSTGGFAPIPLSPGVWTVTNRINPLYRPGAYDYGDGLEQIAEDGDPSILGPNVAAYPHVKSSGIFDTPEGAAGPQPAFPGQSFVFTIEAKAGDVLSFATMFAQSNDLFYGPGPFGIRLFNGWGIPRSGEVTQHVFLWDAGTEVNQEPGVGPDQAPRQAAPNTGESEHKRVWFVHDDYKYPNRREVIKVTITPMDGV